MSRYVCPLEKTWIESCDKLETLHRGLAYSAAFQVAIKEVDRLERIEFPALIEQRRIAEAAKIGFSIRIALTKLVEHSMGEA